MDAMSNGFVEALERLDASIVRVEARRIYPLSGLVWSEEGVVVTTSRAVEREEGIRLGLAGGKAVDAIFVGRDPRTDLAVLRVERGGLTPAPWLEPESLRLGQWVVMAARPRERLQATAGIVGVLEGAWRTATGSQVEQLIQSDAEQFPGFSGGPLASATGEVIGVNTSALSRRMAVTLPLSTLRRVVGSLLEHGRMRRAYLGVMGQPVRLPGPLAEKLEQRAGVMLVSVEPDSPAARAGLSLGDTLVSLDGEAVQRPADLLELLDESRIGRSLTARVVRGGQLQDISLAVGER